MTTVLLTLALFGLCMVGMSLGVILSGRRLRGSCGGDAVVAPDGEVISCGSCPSKENDVCPSDDELVALARIAYPRGHHDG